MFNVITRKEYWDWLDELAPQAHCRGLFRRTRRSLALQRYHLGVGRDYALKTVQDTYVYHSCRHASLPDNIMYRWQQGNPSIKREIAQLVSIKAEWVKV